MTSPSIDPRGVRLPDETAPLPSDNRSIGDRAPDDAATLMGRRGRDRYHWSDVLAHEFLFSVGGIYSMRDAVMREWSARLGGAPAGRARRVRKRYELAVTQMRQT